MYNLTVDFHWYISPEKKREIIKVYKINGVSYAHDYLPKNEKENPEVIALANQNIEIDQLYIFYGSFYLMAEEAHPLLFDLTIANPELLSSD